MSDVVRDEVSGADRIRVIVGDDHPLMLDAMVGRLRTDPSIEVVGTATNGSELLDLYGQEHPDVVVSDYRMPGLSGADLVRAIVELDPDAKLLIVSAYDDASFVAAGLGGAVGYVLKTVTGPELVAKVHAVAKGKQSVDREALERLIDQVRASQGTESESENPLTRREQEVLTLVSQGLTNAEVAERLFISAQTVKTHLDRIYAKLEAPHRAAAVREATIRGLIPRS